MHIEKEPIGRLVAQLYRKNTKLVLENLEKLGIGSGQYFFMAELYRQDGITQEELTEKVFVDKATTARAIKKLEELGYVKREVSKIDRRAYNVYLTQKANEIKEDFFEALKSNEKRIVEKITNEEVDVLRNILKKLLELR